MTDRYARFAQSRVGRLVVRGIGLPSPPRLRRYQPAEPEFAGPVLLGGRGRMTWPATEILDRLGVRALSDTKHPHAAVFDATGIADSAELRLLYDFFHPIARSVKPGGRIVVLGTPPSACGQVRQATAQRALDGFTRSLAREIGRGTTANLVQLAPGAEGAAESTLRFLLSTRSAYVSGQVIRVSPASVTPPDDWQHALSGTVAIVTGAARGIGAETARVLARDGAQVACLDVPSAGSRLAKLSNELRGSAIQLDLAAPDAPDRLSQWISDRCGQVSVLVHNAGITRDRTLGKMKASRWDDVIAVNLTAQERINEALLANSLLADNGRLITVSSVSGIAGNRGQTNYAASKAGLIGYVEALADVVAMRGITTNAVAPGFIESEMTQTMPRLPRAAARRLNSLTQPGLPVDVAEAIAWLAQPASAGITGTTVRVCGQSLVGA